MTAASTEMSHSSYETGLPSDSSRRSRSFPGSVGFERPTSKSWTGAAFQEHRTGAACAETLRCLIEARAPLDLVDEAGSLAAFLWGFEPTPAQRPANSRLDTRKLRHAFGLVLPAWQQGVERMLDEILPN